MENPNLKFSCFEMSESQHHHACRCIYEFFNIAESGLTLDDFRIQVSTLFKHHRSYAESPYTLQMGEGLCYRTLLLELDLVFAPRPLYHSYAGGHIWSARAQDKRNVGPRIQVDKQKVNFDHLVFTLMGSALGGTKNVDDFFGKILGHADLTHLCGSVNCLAPAHLAYEDIAVRADRQSCHKGDITNCHHIPRCVLGSKKPPFPLEKPQEPITTNQPPVVWLPVKQEIKQEIEEELLLGL